MKIVILVLGLLLVTVAASVRLLGRGDRATRNTGPFAQSEEAPAEHVEMPPPPPPPAALPVQSPQPQPQPPVSVGNLPAPSVGGVQAAPAAAVVNRGITPVREWRDPDFGRQTHAGRLEADEQDPQVYRALMHAKKDFIEAPGTTDCLRAQALRLGRSFLVETVATLTLDVRDGFANVADLEFPSAEQTVQGDLQFQRCFRDAVRSVRFSCAACGDGKVTFRYPIQRFINVTNEEIAAANRSEAARTH